MPVDFKTRVPMRIPTVMITIVPDAATAISHIFIES